MKVIKIVNTEYYSWEIPEELLDLNKTEQELVDEYFDPDSLLVAQDGDTYYEYHSTIEEED